jgi:nitroreductase
VPEEKVEKILEAIRLAPSSIGLQPYSVIVITDVYLKKKNFAKLIPTANYRIFTPFGICGVG